MKKLIFAALAIACASAPGLAADMPVKAPILKAPPPVFSWTGFYLGGNVGGHWGDDRLTTTTSPPNFVAGYAAALDLVTPTTLRPQGVIGGVQAGYNWQSGGAVLGLEADADWLGGTASRSVVFGPLAGIGAGTFMNDSVNETFLATVRGRLGWAVDRALFYGTGGVAIGTVKTVDNLGFPGNFNDITSATTTRTGWTAGAGIEYAFTGGWSAKVEYLHVDLGTINVGFVCTVAPCVTVNDSVVHHRYTDEIARFGLNYRFGGPVVAKY